MKDKKTRYIAFGGIIAALYVALTYLANLFGLASGAIQIRISEALTILPVFTGAAVPGLAVGCLLANLLTGCAIWDVIFGSAATLIGAVGTRLLRNRPYAAWIPPVASNALIVPIILMKVYFVEDVEVFGQAFSGNALWPILAVTVGVGEIISCCLLGLALYHALKRTGIQF